MLKKSPNANKLVNCIKSAWNWTFQETPGLQKDIQKEEKEREMVEKKETVHR